MLKKPLLLKLSALMVSCTIFAIAMLGLYTWRVYRQPFKRTDLRFEGDWPLQGDEVLGYTGIANGKTRMRKLALGLSYHIYTDDSMARVNQPGDQKPDDIEVLTIGDSCSYGYGLDNEATFSECIERDTGLHTANYAQVGYSTLQSLLMLERQLARGLHPKIVIYGYIEDHLSRNLSPCAPSGAPYCLPAPHLDLKSVPPRIVPPDMQYFTPEQNWRYFREILTSEGPGWHDLVWRLRIDLFRIRTSAELQPAMDPDQKAAALTFLIAELANRCEAIGATLVVVFLPYFNQDPMLGPSDTLRQAIDQRALLLDLTPAAQQAPKNSLGLKGDGHPNREAHALIAAQLVDLFRAQGWLPSSTGQPVKLGKGSQ